MLESGAMGGKRETGDGVAGDHHPQPAIHRLQRRSQDADVAFHAAQDQEAAAQPLEGGGEAFAGVGGKSVLVDLRPVRRLVRQRRHEIQQFGRYLLLCHLRPVAIELLPYAPRIPDAGGCDEAGIKRALRTVVDQAMDVGQDRVQSGNAPARILGE